MSSQINTRALLASVRRSVDEGLELDRAHHRERRDEQFEASIEKRLEAAEYKTAQATNDYHVANVESVAQLIPIVGPAAGRAVTMGKEGRRGFASLIGAGGIYDAVNPEQYGPEMLREADAAEAIENGSRQEQASIEAEELRKASDDAKEQLADVRQARRQLLDDQRAAHAELSRAVEKATS